MGKTSLVKTPSAAVVLLACTLAPDRGTAQQAFDLSGLWAHRVVTTSVSKLPVLGKIDNESRFFALARVAQQGSTLDIQLEPCWVRMIGEVSRVQTVVPDEAVAVMGPRRRTGTLDGQRLSISRAVDVIGARLANEWSDALPDSTEHPAQWDEDRDGKPGVTIRIMGPIDGEVYVAQRSWNSLEGTVDADGSRITGLVAWTTEQRVLDATSMFLRANPSSTPHPDKSKSHFHMQRVPADTSCVEVKRRNDAIFGGSP